MENHNPRDCDSGAEESAPFKRNLFHAEKSKKFNPVGDENLSHHDCERCAGRTETIHAFDDAPGDKCPEDTADQQVPGANLKKRRERSTVSK